MKSTEGYLKSLLHNLRVVREKASLTVTELEERLILGPGWITRFEAGETIPSIDMLLAILHATNANVSDLLEGLPAYPDASEIERFLFAEPTGNDLLIHFQYGDFEASYLLERATTDEFEVVLKTLRNTLAFTAMGNQAKDSHKKEAVAASFLKAVTLWPHANPADLWNFVISRAYCDPYNHPAKFARMDLHQSWKRTGGWALEEIAVRHYGPFLKQHGIQLYIADLPTKQNIISRIDVGERLEADKMDVLLTTYPGNEFLGVIHVKASFAERRTDDVPMSTALRRMGYLTPFWTMDCKSVPSSRPFTRGELGTIEGRRSAKRKDIENDGYFTGCFSYNRNTQPSTDDLPPERRIYVCDFSNPDDTFSNFIISQRKRSL